MSIQMPPDITMKGLLDTDEAAHYLRHRTQTLAAWRMRGKGPRYSKIGKRVWYSKEDIDLWITEQFEENAR